MNETRIDDLVAGARSGSEACFVELMEQYRGLVSRCGASLILVYCIYPLLEKNGRMKAIIGMHPQ